jgi:hypothetical protein
LILSIKYTCFALNFCAETDDYRAELMNYRAEIGNFCAVILRFHAGTGGFCAVIERFCAVSGDSCAGFIRFCAVFPRRILSETASCTEAERNGGISYCPNCDFNMIILIFMIYRI